MKPKKIAIFHDYFRVVGGAEKLVLTMAKHLGADVITAQINPECIKYTGFDDVKIISLGRISKFAQLLPSACMKRFSQCDFSSKYDFFIFSGSFSIYAAKKHKPNMWYCHTPLKGLYDEPSNDMPVDRMGMNLKEVGRNWNEFGEVDPLWSILTHKDKKNNLWNKKEFFNTGDILMQSTMREIQSLYPGLVYENALDFGCGVGRLTNPLGNYFKKVTGVDIAPSMIQLAKQYQKNNNCAFLLNTKPDLTLFQNCQFDFICSFITLQHMSLMYQLEYLKEFARILKPKGLMVFNIPNGLTLKTEKKIKEAQAIWQPKKRYFNKGPIMEMHYTSEKTIIEHLKENDIELIQYNCSARGPIISCKYIGFKKHG